MAKYALVEDLIDKWAQQGYTPSPMSRRFFRSNFRAAVEMAIADFAAAVAERDELEAVLLADRLLGRIRRMDAQLRTELAADHHPGRTRAA